MQRRSNLGIAKQQRGFTLVFVLVLLLMASVIVFKTMQSNIQQERTSGNMRKQINAQLAAEQGVYNIFTELQQLVENSPNPINDAEDLINELLNSGVSLQGNGSVAGSQYQVEMDDDGNILRLISTGTSYEGEKVINALISFSPAGSATSAPYINAVTGCNGVSLQGSGIVDSFDSVLGNYSSDIADVNATVSTIYPDAGIELQGNSPIYGDVLGTGNVTVLGSSPVIGNIHANGDVSILGGNGRYDYRVSGYVWARGDYQQASVSVYGDVWTDGEASLTWGSEIITGILHYGGELSIPDYWNGDTSGFSRQNPDIPLVPNSGSEEPESFAECDPLGIETMMADLRSDESLPALDIGPWRQRNYELTPSAGRFTDNEEAPLLPETISVGGNSVSAYRLNSLSVTQNGTLDITGGDVIVYIEEDFEMHGGVDLTIAADSSLTLYIEGRFSFTGGAISVQQHGLTSNGVPALSIYSSYVSSDDNDMGVELGGASDIYGVVYAPFANVDIRGSGELFGAVIGHTVQVTGAGGVHFDEALADSTLPTETNSGEVTLTLDGLYTY